MSLQYKAYLSNEKGDVKEIRRFAIDTDVTSSYDYLVKKVASVFPDLSEGSFSLQWKDEEGDMIAFSSDDELMQSLGVVNDGVMKLYILEKSQTSEEPSPEGRPGQGRGQGGPGGRGRRCGKGRGPWVGFVPPPAYPYGQYPHQNPVPPPPCFGWNAAGSVFDPANFFHSQFQQQQSNATPPPSADNSQQQNTSDSQQQNTSQQQGNNGGEDYLQSVGQTVASMLRPFGIDVDIDIEHRGKRSKCNKGGKNKKKQEKKKQNEEESEMQTDETQTKQQPGSSGTPTNNREGKSSDHEWTVVQDDEPNENKEVIPPSAPEPMQEETVPMDADPRLSESLNQMLSMGFNNNDGWLSRLLVEHDYNIAGVLEAMQRNTVAGFSRA